MLPLPSDFLSHLLADDLSLLMYQHGDEVEIKDLKRHLLLSERTNNYAKNNKLYESELEDTFNDITHVKELFTKLLPDYASKFLKIDSHTIKVKADKMNDWQLLIAEFPPLLLLAEFLYKEGEKQEGKKQLWLNNCATVNTQYSALPLADFTFTKLHDLHIHQSCVMESDVMWIKCLQNPGVLSTDLYNAILNEDLICLFESVLPSFDRLDLYNFLNKAIGLRNDIIDTLYLNIPIGESLTDELLLFNETIRYLSEYGKGRNEIASKFHHYLLLRGLFHKISVVGKKDYGFDRFQLFAHLPWRTKYEKQCLKESILQLCGNNNNSVKHIEFRISTKKNMSILETIQEIENVIETEINPTKADNDKVTFSVVVSFIKSYKNKCYLEQAKLINEIFHKDAPQRKYVVGVDAAGSEFNASPVEFHGAFQYLRRKGVKNFTYHVGEDFYSLLSGIRVVFEAVNYLKLGSGNRLGHTSALGVEPNVWLETVGEVIKMSKQSYILDIIFLNYLVRKKLVHFSKSINKKIKTEFEEICPNKNLSNTITEWLNTSSEQFSTEKNNEIKVALCATEQEYNYCYPIPLNRLTEVQLAVLNILCDKGVVIETCPTSNIFIGPHRTFKTHQLRQWFMWKKQGYKIPDIVIGTDDPGVFSTNIHNEYSNAICSLRGIIDEKKFVQSIEESYTGARFH